MLINSALSVCVANMPDTHLLWGIDDACVVAKLQRTDDGCCNRVDKVASHLLWLWRDPNRYERLNKYTGGVSAQSATVWAP